MQSYKKNDAHREVEGFLDSIVNPHKKKKGRKNGPLMR